MGEGGGGSWSGERARGRGRRDGRSWGSRGLGLLSVGVVALALGAVGAGTASAAPSSELVYSTDGGTTWTTSPTVGSGQDVVVRLYYDNDTDGTIDGTQLTTSLPAGFSLVSGSTETCLNPGTTDPTMPAAELECNTDTGGAAPNDEGGPIDEAAVWNSGTLTISPTAGLFDEPTDQTSGPLAMGKTEYLNLEQCDYEGGTNLYTNFVQTANTSGAFDAGTDTSNTAAAVTCGPGAGSFTEVGENSAAEAIDLLGQEYLNLDQCEYGGAVNAYTAAVDDTTNSGGAFDAGTAASNTAATSVTCGSAGSGYTEVPVNSAVTALDVLDNQYVNLDECSYNSSTDTYTAIEDTTNSGGAYDTGTDASNTAQTSDTCGAGVSGRTLVSVNSGFLALDTLDTTRGQGFVQFEMTAPTVTTSTTETENGGLTGSGTGDPTTTGSLTVTPLAGTPLGDPLVAGGAGVGVLAIGALVIRRRLNRKVA